MAVEETVRASGMNETGSVMRHPDMQNPTLVVLTDRNALDDQLFGQFQRCADILGQTPYLRRLVWSRIPVPSKRRRKSSCR